MSKKENALCCPWDIDYVEPADPRYTQRSSDSEYARSQAQLDADQTRKPTLHEGVSFKEAI